MKIGVQMYTIRDFCTTEDDFKLSMEKIAAIGYKSVQLSVHGHIPAAKIAEICKNNGIEIVSTHTPPQLILDETERIIREHKMMGCGFIGIGSLPGTYERDAKGLNKFVEDFIPVCKKIKEAGLMFMYHNHAFEFEKVDGKLIIDYLIEGFDKDLMGFTLDTYWVQAGGGDPVWWLDKLSGRVDTIHFKDAMVYQGQLTMTEVMEGNLNWDAIFKACERAGVKWTFIEQDKCHGKDPFECLKISYDNLAAKGYR